MEDFLQDCFVSIGYPGVGDLEAADAAEVSDRLHTVYGYEGTELRRRLEEVMIFASGMEDGDYVLVPHGIHVWLGDLGDYYYREEADTAEEATCHRRGVTWLGVLPVDTLNPLLQGFLHETEEGSSGEPEERTAAARFPLSPERAGLEAFAAQAPGGQLPGLLSVPPESAVGTEASEAAPRPVKDRTSVEAETLQAAVAVLREALRSSDPELRVRAAEALLRYAK